MNKSSIEGIVDYVVDYMTTQRELRNQMAFEVETRINEIIQKEVITLEMFDKYKQESFIAKGFTEYNLKILMEIDYIEKSLSDEERIKEAYLGQLIENL